MVKYLCSVELCSFSLPSKTMNIICPLVKSTSRIPPLTTFCTESLKTHFSSNKYNLYYALKHYRNRLVPYEGLRKPILK